MSGETTTTETTTTETPAPTPQEQGTETPQETPADKPADETTNTPASTLLTEDEGEGGETSETETGETAGEESQKADEVPETYELNAPEGFTLDDALLAQVSPKFREAGLTQAQAQAVVDLLPAVGQRHQEVWAQQVADWQQATKTDKEIGGAKLAENIALAKRAMVQFATPELKSMLDEVGIGNHPEMVRLMSRIGRAISEDSIGGKPATAPKTAEELFYGKVDVVQAGTE